MGQPIIDRRISFNGGEISPWIDPRVDLEKYRSGCTEQRNFIPKVYGGSFRRPGTLYEWTAKFPDKKSRVEEFEFSVTTTLILEFGDNYVRFGTTGEGAALIEDPDDAGEPLELVTPWSDEILFELQFAQLNDLVIITHGTTRPHLLIRLANNSWTLTPIEDEWPASLDDNVTEITLEVTGGDPPASYPAWVFASVHSIGDRVSYNGVNYRCIYPITKGEPRVYPPGTYANSSSYWTPLDMSFTFGIGQSVDIESSEPLFAAGHVGSTWVIKHRRDDPSVNILLSAAIGDTSDPLFVLGEWAANVQVDVGGTWEVKAAIERSYDKVTWETILTISSTGSTSGVKSGTELSPCYLRIKILDKTGSPPASASFIIEASDSYHYGLLYITAFTDTENVEARVVFPPVSGPTKYWNEAAWSDVRGFPRAVTFHENRLFFGGSSGSPQTVWGSVIDDYYNYRVSAEDDGGLSFRLASDASNGIQWIVGQESLIIGTTGSEWTVGTRETQSALTPSTIAAKRSTTYGSTLIQAVVVSDAVLFVQRSARKVREFVYTFEEDGYTAQDLTLLSEQITDSTIIQIAVQKNPETIMWCICGNGDLVGVVYERGQNVAGWFRFDTGVIKNDAGVELSRDYFESVAVVSGSGEEDEIWVSVRRTVDGETIRYIERFQPNLIRKLKDGDQTTLCYVDCAKIVTGDGITEITGADHLEGRSVSILSNGSPEPNATVTDGGFPLEFEADTVVYGLPFESILTPTPLETTDPGTVTPYSKKKVADMILGVWQTTGFKATASGGRIWSPVEFRQPNDFMDSPVPLFSGQFETLTLDSDSTRTALVSVKQDQPLPLNVLSIYIKYEVNAT